MQSLNRACSRPTVRYRKAINTLSSTMTSPSKGIAMTHAHDDIMVGTLCLPFIGNGWVMPWGEVVSNPLKAQRLAEEYRERQEVA